MAGSNPDEGDIFSERYLARKGVVRYRSHSRERERGREQLTDERVDVEISFVSHNFEFPT